MMSEELFKKKVNGMQVALVTDRLHYFNGNVPGSTVHNRKTLVCFPVKESMFLAEGGFESFDINTLETSPLVNLIGSSFKESLIEGSGVGIAVAFSAKFINGERSVPNKLLNRLTPSEAIGAVLAFEMLELAWKGVEIDSWPVTILDTLKQAPKRYPEVAGIRDMAEQAKHYWKTYLEFRYGNAKGKGKPIRNNRGVIVFKMMIPAQRYEYYSSQPWTQFSTILIQSISSTICVFDALLDAGGNWEKLLRYLVLLDYDDRGAGLLSGALFGCLYGSSKVPQRWLANLSKS